MGNYWSEQASGPPSYDGETAPHQKGRYNPAPALVSVSHSEKNAPRHDSEPCTPQHLLKSRLRKSPIDNFLANRDRAHDHRKGSSFRVVLGKDSCGQLDHQ